jgi:predicted transcriptional regulator of viral defense system
MHLTPRVHSLFAQQHGVISRRQLIECGLTPRQIRRLIQVGAIECVLREAYRSPSVVWNEHARCTAVCLGRPDVVIAGPTAGRLWGMRRLPPDHRIHVISPPASNPSIAPWVVPYRTAAIRPSDVVHREDGIRVTTRARTAFDLTRWLGADDLLSVIEQTMHDGRIS